MIGNGLKYLAGSKLILNEVEANRIRSQVSCLVKERDFSRVKNAALGISTRLAFTRNSPRDNEY